MAGEKKGDAFEVITYLALEAMGYRIGTNLHWETKSKGISIDPDFILGDLDSPAHWILATSSGSAKNSLEKFWRNVGELFEVKRNFQRPPKVVNLVFETNLRAALQRAMLSILDGELLVQNQSYGPVLVEFIENTLKEMPNAKAEKIEYYKKLLNRDGKVLRAHQEFCNDLKAVLTKEKKEFRKLWNILRNESRTSERIEARNTFARRGLAKILILSPNDSGSLVRKVKSKKNLADVPDFALQLGIAKKSIGGIRVTDPDALWAIHNLDESTIKKVVEESYSARMQNWDNWINALNQASVSSNHEFVVNHYKELITKKGMLKHLLEHAPDDYKWLFTHLMEIFKFETGKRQGYGYSVLSKEVGYADGISRGYLELSDWVNGLSSSPSSTKLLPDVAEALAKRLKVISVEKLKGMGKDIQFESLRNLLEQKIVAYWLFEPLQIMIRKKLKEVGAPFKMVKKHPTIIGEYVGEPTKVASPTVILSNKVLIGWRSAYDLGKHHKTKELSGRAQALRYEYDGVSFARRNSIEAMCLVIDGTFTEEQIYTMQQAGWDRVFYPDQMDELAKAIL